MRIVLVLKPYAIEVYSRESDIYTLISVERSTEIDGESLSDYEKRMIFVCKDLCLEMKASSYFKDVAHKLKGIDIVLCSPWCTYDVVQVEKDLGKKTKITNAVLKEMFVKKDEKEFHVIESYTSNMLLNGYKVDHISDQMAQTVQFQYVHIYARESFATGLIKTMETVFHTHQVALTSVYGLVAYASKQRTEKHISEIQIILEDESVDIAYIHDGLRIMNVFVPYSYVQVEHTIAMNLSAHSSVVEEMLLSRGRYVQNPEAVVPDKNAKKLWPDLDAEVKHKVNTLLSEGVEKIVQHVRNCVDTIDVEYLKNTTEIYVYCTNANLALAYGNELATRVTTDPYITMKIHTPAEAHPAISIF